MSIKQKFESIDQSQLSENQKEILGKIKTATKDFTITDEKALEKVDSALDNIITKLKATNPQAIKVEAKKREPRAKKEVVKKEPKSETKKPKKDKKESSGKRTIFSIAKEIRKADESWEDAKARAKKVMETEKKDTTKKMKTETDKLLAFIKRRKELEGLSGTSIKKDSKIEALPKGRRVSKKGWKNQHGESQGGKVYYENRDNRTDRLAPNFADKIYLADGGGVGKKLTAGVYRVGKPIKVGKMYEQKVAIISDNGQVRSNSEFGITKTDFISMKNPMITEKQFYSLNNYADGGTIIGTPETPLGRDLGISYTGLVGETGAMSSGEMFAYGGKTKSRPSMRELYIEQIAFATNTKKEGVDAFAKDNNLNDAELSNLMTGIGRKMISQSDFVTALVGNKNNTKQKEVVAFAKSDKAYKMADGGTIIGTPETALARGLDMGYTGLVGETGAMSSGEMFAGGGSLMQNKILNKSDVDYNVTILPTGDFTDTYNLIIQRNSNEFGGSSHSVVKILSKKEAKRIFDKVNDSNAEEMYRIFAKMPTHKNKKFELGGSTGLPAGAEQQFVNYYLNEGASTGIFQQGGVLVAEPTEGYLTDANFGDFQAGVYAEGGSLGNHGLKQGDQIIKTMSGGVQKVKTKSGDIVYVNLANGYRGAEPPLPFDDGGMTSNSNEYIYATQLLRRGLMRGDLTQEEANSPLAFDIALEEAEDWVDAEEMGSSDFGYMYRNFLQTYKEVKEKSGSFDKGGRTKDRKYVNYSQKHEVRYSKDKPKRRGYGYEDGGSVETKVSALYSNYGFINDDMNWQFQLLEMLQNPSYEAYEIYQSLTDSQKDEVLQELYEMDNDMGMDGDGDIETSKENLEIILDDSKKAKPKFADGGLIGKEVTFMSQGEKDRGIIGEVNEDGSLAVDTGRSLRLVEKDEIVEIHDKPKKRGFFFDNGGTIDAFQMRTVKGVDNNPTEILTDEQKVQFARGGGVKKGEKYIPKAEIKEVWVKTDKDIQFTFKGSDVLNGVNVLEKGNLLKNDATYVAKRNIMYVVLKNGEKVKPSNGYWIKKDAKGELFKPEKEQKEEKEEKMTYEEFLKKRPKSVTGYTYGTDWGGGKLKFEKRTFYYGYSKWEDRVGWYNRGKGKKITDEVAYKLYLEESSSNNGKKSYAGGGWVDGKYDKNKLLMLIGDDLLIRTDDGTELILYNPYSNNDDNRVLWDSDDYVIGLVPNDGDEVKVRYEDIVSINKNPNYMIDGGKTTFDDKATAIAKNFKGKKVKPKYQKEYGKVYDKAEAKEVGKRVAGSQKAKYDSKMATGGNVSKIYVVEYEVNGNKKTSEYLLYENDKVEKMLPSNAKIISIKEKMMAGGTTKRGGAMVLAKQIRKDGESWSSALKRANEQMRKK